MKRPDKQTNQRLLRERGESAETLIVRDAEVKDIHELAELHVLTWNEAYAGILQNGPSVATREAQWRQKFAQKEPDWFCLLATRADGTLVGFAQGQRKDEHGAELNKIYLHRDYQRIGLGRRLMGLATQRFIDLGFRSMSLYVDPRNPSCAFYEALGGKHYIEPDGRINYSWYVWDDLPALLASCTAGPRSA